MGTGKEKSKLDIAITIATVCIALYHLINIMWIVFSNSQTKIIHVFSGLIVVYLFLLKEGYDERSIRKKLAALFFLTVSTVISGYFFFNSFELEHSLGIPTQMQTIMGCIMLALVFEANVRAWGVVIPFVVFLALLYGIFGQHLPGVFYHSGLSFGRLIGYSCTYFQGLYGSLPGLSAREIFSFIMLGAFLANSGGIGFFMKAGQELGGSLRSRGAVTAIISSSLMGTVSGSIPANVATTGCVTIPMMIESKYSKEYAGAVEAAASTGGQIMPPVMGVAAFIIADNLGISYGLVCLAALIPAIIYYLFLLVQVQITAVKMDIPAGPPRLGRFWKLCREEGYVMLCMVVLIIVLSFGWPVQRAALAAIISLVVMTFIKKWHVHGRDRKAFVKDFLGFLVRALREGATGSMKLGLIMALLGVMVEMFVVTGFAQRISFQMVHLAGNSYLLLLILVAVTCLLFGCGMPTTGAYLTVSLLAAPALIQFGMSDLAAQFFVFYYAVMAAVTPPVGSAALVASGISGGSYLMTACHAVKMTLPGFIMPFYFAYRPSLLMLETSTLSTVVTSLVVFGSIVSLGCILERFMFTKMSIWQMVVLGGGIALSFNNDIATSMVCVLLFGLVFMVQFLGWKKSMVEAQQPC